MFRPYDPKIGFGVPDETRDLILRGTVGVKLELQLMHFETLTKQYRASLTIPKMVTISNEIRLLVRAINSDHTLPAPFMIRKPNRVITMMWSIMHEREEW